MIKSGDLFKCARIAQERHDLINIHGTTLRVVEAVTLIGDGSTAIRSRIVMAIDGEITEALLQLFELLLVSLDGITIDEYLGSVIIEFYSEDKE